MNREDFIDKVYERTLKHKGEKMVVNNTSRHVVEWILYAAEELGTIFPYHRCQAQTEPLTEFEQNILSSINDVTQSIVKDGSKWLDEIYGSDGPILKFKDE